MTAPTPAGQARADRGEAWAQADPLYVQLVRLLRDRRVQVVVRQPDAFVHVHGTMHQADAEALAAAAVEVLRGETR